MTRKDDKGDQPICGRDDLDKYWSDTIWQMTEQDRLTWRKHAEAFANPPDTTGCPMMMMMTGKRLIDCDL